MRALALIFLLASAPVARASADALLAASQGALREGASTTGSIAIGGLAASHGDGAGWLYASAAWPSGTLEAGRGARLGASGGWSAYWAAGAHVAPRGGLTFGARAIAGGSFLAQGDTFFVRPGVAVSLALAGGAVAAASLLAPVEASVDVGLALGSAWPFLRLSAGVDPVAGARWTGRGEIALGLALE